MRRGPRTDGALRVTDREIQLTLLAALEETRRILQELVVERRRRLVALLLHTICRVRAIDANQ
jgi:hypothetical protein